MSECSQLSEGLGAKLWCVKGITIFSFLENYELKVKFKESRRLHLISFAKNSIIIVSDNDFLTFPAHSCKDYRICER